MAHDLYGFDCNDLEEVREAFEKAMHVTMAPHESGYHGGDYYRVGMGKEEFVLQWNREIVRFRDIETAEEEFPEVPILLYVDNTNRPEEIERILTATIPRIRLLRRKK